MGFYAGMEILRELGVMQAWAATCRRAGEVIGLVPTMGFLHEGHLSLVRIARNRADRVVVSLFVNPTQFGPKEDLGRYPRDFERDLALCESEGVDVLFVPTADAMYPAGFSTYVIEEALGDGLCGASRPGHFRGVATVVTKLFNLTLPDFAVFGEKDAQQVRVIRRMVRDLNQPVTIITGPTAREPDGLAMSSRNSLLSPAERAEAACLSRGLAAAHARYAGGEREAAPLKAVVASIIAIEAPHGIVDYIELVDDVTLRSVETITGPALLAVAVRFSATRLIDNITLGY
jgi:pantoate--beta-alanine ligase